MSLKNGETDYLSFSEDDCTEYQESAALAVETTSYVLWLALIGVLARTYLAFRAQIN
jgi:hypothetical protein